MAFLDRNIEKNTITHQEIAPLLWERTQVIIEHCDPRLQQLEQRAICNNLYPIENGPPVPILATNSFPEQMKYLKTLPGNEDIAERIKKWGMGAMIDSIKQNDINRAGGCELGDAYIMRNLESIMQFAKSKGIDIMVGRYSGDELIAVFIPHQAMDAKILSAEFADFNKKFLQAKHPINEKLQSHLNTLRKTHGNTLTLGASVKAINLTNLKYSPSHTHRERQLLGEIIDHIEEKHQSGGESNLIDDLLYNWSLERKLPFDPESEVYKNWLNKLLPPSIKALYESARQVGVSIEIAAAYADEATFEGLFEREKVYRMEVFGEITQKNIDKYGPVVMIKSGDPFLKDANKDISHHAGDIRMKKLADHMTGMLATFQNHGSLIHLISHSDAPRLAEYWEEAQVKQPTANLDRSNHNPDTFFVVTTVLEEDEEGKPIFAMLNKEIDPQTIYTYLETLQVEQTWNELRILTIHAGLSPVMLDVLIDNYLDPRPKRAIDELDMIDMLEDTGKLTKDAAERIETATRELIHQHGIQNPPLSRRSPPSNLPGPV